MVNIVGVATRDPLTLFELPKVLPRDEAEEFVLRHLEELSVLIGIRLPSQSPLEAFLEARKLVREYKTLCAETDGTRYCLYQYKGLGADTYMQRPILAAMRGSVLEFPRGGGAVLRAFPFAKFFNVGEVPQARIPERGVATLKLDGTLIIAWRGATGELRFNTRGLLQWFNARKVRGGWIYEKGGERTNPYINAFLRAVERMGLVKDLEDLVRDGETVMFELVHPDVPASTTKTPPPPGDPKWTVYALARRENRYPWRLEPLRGTPFPEPETVEYRGPDDLIDTVSGWRDKEGVVVYTEQHYGEHPYLVWWTLLVKVKSAPYFVATVLGRGASWRQLARAVIGGAYDDIVAYAEPERREFAERLWKQYVAARDAWERIVELARNRWDRATRNYLANTLGWRFLAEMIDRALTGDTEAPLRGFFSRDLPRDKNGVVNAAARRRRLLEKALAKLKERWGI